MMRDVHPIHTDMQQVVSYTVRARQDLQRTLMRETEEAAANPGHNAWEGQNTSS